MKNFTGKCQPRQEIDHSHEEVCFIIFNRSTVLRGVNKREGIPQGCTKKEKQQLEELLLEYKDVFQGPKGLPHKREAEDEIQLLPDSPFPNIGLYRKFVIEESEMKK